MIRFKLSRSYYDDPPASPPVSPPPPPPPPPAKTFTQADVDRLMAEHRKGLQTQLQDAVKQLETVRETANLTQQQKDELDARIQTLTQQHQTKEQQLAAEVEKVNKKYKSDTETLAQEGNKWKSSFNNLLVENSIILGAEKHKAASTKQMIALLGSKAKVVEEVDDKGQATGKFVVKLPMVINDAKTKQPVALELDIVEAIGKMREDPENANLFLTDGKPGLGGNNNNAAGGGGGGGFNPSMTPAQYAEFRKKNGLAKT